MNQNIFFILFIFKGNDHFFFGSSFCTREKNGFESVSSTKIEQQYIRALRRGVPTRAKSNTVKMANDGEENKGEKMEVEDKVVTKEGMEGKEKSAEESRVEEELGVDLISAEELETLDSKIAEEKWEIVKNKKMAKISDEEQEERMEKQYKIHVKIRRQLGTKRDIGIVDQFKTLYGRLVALYPSIMLLPFDEKEKAPPILRSEDIPTARESFNVYTRGVKVTKTNNLVMNVKISSPKKIWEMKQNEKLFSYLLDKKWFLQQQEIAAADTIKIGGFLYSHAQFARRDEAAKEVMKRLNEGETELVEVQLPQYTFKLGSGEREIRTRMLAIECDPAKAELVKERIEKAFVMSKENSKWQMTGEYKYFPFKRSAAFTNEKIQQVLMAQNNYLKTTSTIMLHNIGNAKWVVPGTGKTYGEVLMGARKDGKKLIHSVELTPRKEKMVLIVDKSEINYTWGWLGLLHKKIRDKVECPKQWKELTGSDKNISLWGEESTKEQLEYVTRLMEDTKINIGEKAEGELKRPPGKRYATKETQAHKRVRNTENAWSRKPNIRKEEMGSAGGTLMGDFKEELRRMKEESLEATKALEERTRELEETVGTIMEYTRQFRDENKARDIHISDINDRVEIINEGMIEVQDSTEDLTQEQRKHALRLDLLEKVVKKLKVKVDGINPKRSWEDSLEDGSEDEMSDEEEVDEGMEDCEALGKTMKRTSGMALVSPETTRKKMDTDEAPPAVRYSLRGGVNK